MNDTPRLWRDMTPEEKGALLLAHHEGKTIEFLFYGKWLPLQHQSFSGEDRYRVKPEPPQPREWWINPSLNHPRISDCEPSKPHAYIRVREVLP